MFDIGAPELLIVAVLALVVVGPKELPKLLRTVAGFVRKAREMAAEFRSGVEDLAAEVEREIDPFADLREQEGLRPGMSASEITDHILANRDAEEAADANVSPDKPEKSEEKLPKSEVKPAKSEEKPAKKESKSAKTKSNDAKKAKKLSSAKNSAVTKKPSSAKKPASAKKSTTTKSTDADVEGDSA